MMQHDKPEDFVIATGKAHSIREFLQIAFSAVDITDWEKYVKQDPRFMRPAEVDVLRGDSTKAREILGWEPETSFEDMVKNMVKNDLELLS
jgi:GDPmannose 4,6-dehydratase